jgi:hypothetical protein
MHEWNYVGRFTASPQSILRTRSFKLHHVYICKFMLRCASTSLEHTWGDRITLKFSSKCQVLDELNEIDPLELLLPKDDVQLGAP